MVTQLIILLLCRFIQSHNHNVRYSLRSIGIIIENRPIKNPPMHAHTRTWDTRTHNDTGRGFYDLYGINLFISSKTSKLFQRGLRQIGLHAPKRYLFYWTQPAWRWTRHGLSIWKLWPLLHTLCLYNLFVTSIRSVDQQRNSTPKTLKSLSNRGRLGW